MSDAAKKLAAEFTPDNIRTAEVPPTEEGSASEQQARVFTYRDLLEREITEVPTLFEGMIISKGFGIVYGPADCGKSMFLRQMCACVGAGREFLGWKYQGTRQRAIYFSSEDDENITAVAVKKVNRSLELPEDVQDNIRYVFDFTAEELPELLREQLTEFPADLVVIDAFGDAFTGRNTNDNTEVRNFYKAFDPIIKEFEVCIIFNHHASKYAANIAPGKSSSLGSEAIVSRPRFAFELRPDNNGGDQVYLCMTKGNYAPNSMKRDAIVLRRDNYLAFYATTERVPFADLAIKETLKKSKQPQSYTEDTHINLLRSIFASAGGRVNTNTLKYGIKTQFEVSDKPAREFVRYYETMKYIQPESQERKQGSSVYYTLSDNIK